FYLTGVFLGKVGRLFAAAIKATPMAIRKNEKNWPRVNGPINSASGSRKFSMMILKIAYQMKNKPVRTPFGWRVRVRTNHKMRNKTIPSKNASQSCDGWRADKIERSAVATSG